MGVFLLKVWEVLLFIYLDEMRKYMDDYFLKSLVENIRKGKGVLYFNVKEVFSYLKENNCFIYIVSNGLKEYLEVIVDYYDLNNWVIEIFSI